MGVIVGVDEAVDVGEASITVFVAITGVEVESPIVCGVGNALLAGAQAPRINPKMRTWMMIGDRNGHFSQLFIGS
jgi:hypothetical protein